jgi:hypothetical protein
MDLSASHTFDAPLDEVWAMFSDPAAHVAKFDSMGHRDIEIVEHEETEDGFRLVISRVVDTELPGFAKKVLKPTNTVVTTDEWHGSPDKGYEGHYSAEAKGAPVKVHGTTRIGAEGDRTSYAVKTTVDVKVPLIGGKLSNWAAGMTKDQIQMEFEAGDRWLTGSGST